VLLLARRLEVRGAHDAAGWLYAAGVVAFWSGLTLACADAEGEAVKAAYLVLNLLLIAAGVVLARRVLAVFGGLGVALYVAYLAYAVFRDSVLFPFALMFIGLGVAYLGVLGQRHAPALRTRLPPLLRHWLDVRG
jgi:hypothetical protein